MQRTQKNTAPKAAQSTTQNTENAPRRLSLSPVTLIILLTLSFVAGLLAGSLIVQNKSPEQTAPQQQAPAQQAQPQQNTMEPSAEQKKHIADLEAQAVKDPANRSVLVELGNAYFDAGRYQQSISAYEAALAINGNDADVLTDCGVMYRATRQFDKALEKFAKAQEVQPGHATSLFNTGVVLNFDLHKHDEAVKAWKELLRLHPDAATPDGRPLEELIKQVEAGRE